MKYQGRAHAEWGFKKPEDGWHTVEILEGIDFLKDKEGAIIEDAKGNQLHKIPAKINDENAPDHEADISIIVSKTPFGEQKIADILYGVGKFAAFEKNFPGEVSFFDTKVMNALKTKLPGSFCQMRTETSKDGKYSNVVGIEDMKFVPTKKEGKDTPKATSTPQQDKKAATEPVDDWV